MGTIRYELGADGIATITHDAPGAPVNTMTVQWQADLAAVVERVEADKERIKGVLVTSAKKTFFAGAQLDSVLTMTEADAPAAFAAIEAMKRSFRRLETLGRPVVALLNGAALGGGWELALAAHARFALDERGERTVRFGTPEVSLGLIPGATGITKTVRLLGLMAAQPLLMEGKLFGPREALELGLVDGIGSTMDDLREMALAWIAEHPQAQQPWDRKDYRMPGGTPASPKIAMGLTVAPAMLAAKSRGLYPAAQAILEAMVEGALVDYDTATRIESRKLAKIMTGQTARNMIQAFFYDLNAIKAGKARPQGVSPWKPKRVGVIGAGMMGAGIAQANASRGIPCVLEDVAIDKARQAAKHELVTPSADVADLKGCELIIEAVFEQRALKAQVTREAEPLLAEGGIFASNTSTLPISGLAQASAAPQRFVGLHFFSPVHRMKLVEIIRGKATDDETIARAYDYVLALGKTPIVVNDSRGFFTSRVFGTYVMEGAAMLEEGIAAPLVEHAAEAAGMPVGPLAVLDETSLSLSVHVIEQTRADFAAEGRAYAPVAGEALVERMVKELNRAGRAAGGGFYDYPAGEPKRLWPGLKRFERPGLASDFEELKQRLLYRQAIETARCLAEGVLASVAEANIGSIFGIGFPAWTGGALQFVRSEGLANFERRADALAERHGERFALAPQVREALRRACT
ncbi:3-hydroxyacyl-CoA dehydrogenase NAD-binding domain-containing protein [Piscinibacter sp.]|uniref:3-hydroxyacyl-CoA dehydrogenase NAD-binding domain-containing protein n=1 Tax=Piscinibacter sp. TaxID=1903157 RepID=UPI0035B0F996